MVGLLFRNKIKPDLVSVEKLKGCLVVFAFVKNIESVKIIYFYRIICTLKIIKTTE